MHAVSQVGGADVEADFVLLIPATISCSKHFRRSRAIDHGNRRLHWPSCSGCWCSIMSQMAVNPTLIMSRLRLRVTDLEKDVETLATRLARSQQQLHAIGKVMTATRCCCGERLTLHQMCNCCARNLQYAISCIRRSSSWAKLWGAARMHMRRQASSMQPSSSICRSR